jgi:hypothetical protein
MAKDLNLCLDNMDSEPSDNGFGDTTTFEDNEFYPSDSFDLYSTFVYPSAEDVPQGSIQSDILNLVSHHHGVSSLL